MLDYNATSGTPPIIPVLKKIRKYVSETVRNGEKIIVYPKICWTILEETRTLEGGAAIDTTSDCDIC